MRFRALHIPGKPLLMPNAWDIGSAALFATLGFDAIATTSGGFAATRGRLDGAMSKDEVLTHAGELAAAVDIPVSADLENCFAHDPDGVAATITAAVGLGLAGGSVEDFTGDRDAPMYELAHAAERVRAGRRGRACGPGPVRADGEGRELPARPGGPGRHHRPPAGVPGSRCRRPLRPRVIDPADLRQLLASVDLPVSVLALPGAPDVAALGELGVSRISVGGAIAVAAYGAAINAVTELRDKGTYGYWDLAAAARPVIGEAFSR